MKKLITYFFQGLLYVVPISITFYILYKIFLLLDNLIPLKIPGLGFVILIVIITLLGMVGKSLIARSVISFFEDIMTMTPVIKSLYSSIKDFVSAFVGKDKKFKQPVLVRVNNISNLEKIGFMTQTDLADLGIEGKKVAVYFPHSYAFSGELFIVPAEAVTLLTINSAVAMKFIVSGGVVKNKPEEVGVSNV